MVVISIAHQYHVRVVHVRCIDAQVPCRSPERIVRFSFSLAAFRLQIEDIGPVAPQVPIFAERFDGMFGAAGTIAAHQGICRAILVTAPANTLGMLGVQGEFLLDLFHDCKQRLGAWFGRQDSATRDYQCDKVLKHNRHTGENRQTPIPDATIPGFALLNPMHWTPTSTSPRKRGIRGGVRVI
jgi:hypothetical protein